MVRYPGKLGAAIKSLLARGRDYAPAVLRMGLSLVFLWFGITQLANPESFLGYLPEWKIVQGIPLAPERIIMANGLFDAFLGSLLMLGFFTRIVAILAGLHLLSISFGLGYNDIAVRDVGLSIAAFSVFLSGEDMLCLGRRLGKAR